LAAPETTITSVKRPDAAAVLANDYDPLGDFSPPERDQFEAIGQRFDREELISDIKLSELFSGYEGDDLAGAVTATKAITMQPSSKGVIASIREAWNIGDLQVQISRIREDELYGRIPFDEGQRLTDALRAKMVHTKASSALISWIKSGVMLLPMIKETTYAGLKVGIPAGTAAGTFGAGLAAGVSPPGTRLATIPGAYIAWFGKGFLPGLIVGGAVEAGELEMGLMYDELRNMRDANGNPLDPSIMKPISIALGAVNMLFELAQIDDIIRTIPGGRKLLRGATTETIRRLSKRQLLFKAVGRGLARYGGHVTFETTTEIVQEANNVIFGELAKVISNRLDETDFEPADKKAIVDRLVETAIESAKGFSLIAAPGSIIQTTSEIGQIIPTPELTKWGGAIREGMAKPVTRISKIITGQKIHPRVDVTEAPVPFEELLVWPTGRTVAPWRKLAKERGVDISDIKGPGTVARIKQRIQDAAKKAPEVVPEKPPPSPKDAQQPLTPEEEHQVTQLEASFKAGEPRVIKPRLYIGKMAKKVKQELAVALDVAPERIHGYMEEGWPSIRTPIELTVDEARGYLVYLEHSLQERLDKNQIATYSDMARANADWGDVKELREKLGLPKVNRPFTIVHDQKTRIITIENVRERAIKGVQPSKADIIQTTQINQLNTMMRRVAQATKKGYKLGKVEQKKLYAELQQLRKEKKMRDKLIARIQAKISPEIDFFYREAISLMQDAIDFRDIAPEKKQKANKSLKAFLDKNPEKAQDVPQELRDAIEKRDVSTLSYSELVNINSEMSRLRQLGKLKSREYRLRRARGIKKYTDNILSGLAKAKKNFFPSVERANTLGPPRIFDMLDGGQDFGGPAHEFFYGTTDENVNAEILNTASRYQTMAQKQQDFRVTDRDLAKRRTVGEYQLRLDTLLGTYAAWKNPASQAAFKYGGFVEKISGKNVTILVTDKLYTQIEEALTEAEKALADAYITEYAEHYPRLRNTTIAAENRDPGYEVNYTSIRHEGIEYETTGQELLDEMNERKFYRRVGVYKGFTIARKDIPSEYMKPVKPGLVANWRRAVRVQEHYILNALHIKDMQSVANRPLFKARVTEKFGNPILKSVQHFIKSIANPNFRKAFNELERYSRIGRQHAIVAYLAFNPLTYAKQVPSIMLYWAHSTTGDMLASALNFLYHPRKAYDNAMLIHPQLTDRAIERELAELQATDPQGYKKALKTVNQAGLYGILAMDRMVKAIGINAVYAKNIRKGLSPDASAKIASRITTREQPGFSPKDRARIYFQSEALNWFMIFTNQLGKFYNVTTYDIKALWSNRHYVEAAKSAVALGVVAILIHMIRTGEIPDEPEDIAKALGEQALGQVPFVGPPMVSELAGYQVGAVPPRQAAAKVIRAGKVAYDGDMEKAMQELWEPVSLMLGIPYSGPRKIHKLVESVKE